MEIVAELSRKAIYENARTAVDQEEWSARYNGYIKSQRAADE